MRDQVSVLASRLSGAGFCQGDQSGHGQAHAASRADRTWQGSCHGFPHRPRNSGDDSLRRFLNVSKTKRKPGVDSPGLSAILEI